MYAVAHFLKIHGDVLRVETEDAGSPYLVGAPGDRQQCFRRNAAGVEAVASHLVAFYQNCRHSERGRSRCHRQATRPSADHTDIGCECFSHAPAAIARCYKSNITSWGANVRANVSPR